MSEIHDDKSQYCIPFILERLKVHQEKYLHASNPPPFFIGLNGVQGAGKTVLVSLIKSTLESDPYNLSTVVFSLDDLYLTHADQVALATSHPDNPLLQHRGQPSTHDIPLAVKTFESLHKNEETGIPDYDKSAFNGQGDRVPETEWVKVNKSTDPVEKTIKVVLFEGWSVGFRSLSPTDLRQKWERAVKAREENGDGYIGRLGHNSFQSVQDINTALKEYDQITDQLDIFIHIDAADPQYVYKWRLQQEEGLRAAKGSGMTDAQVRHFVDGYYPAYELFTDTLRAGIFRASSEEKEPSGSRQLHLVVGEDRKVLRVERL